MYVCMYVCMYVRMYMYMYACTYVYYIGMYVVMYVCISICTYEYVCVCARVYDISHGLPDLARLASHTRLRWQNMSCCNISRHIFRRQEMPDAGWSVFWC